MKTKIDNPFLLTILNAKHRVIIYRVIYQLSAPNDIFDSLSKRILCCGMGKYIVAAPSKVIKPAVVDKPNPYKVLNPLKNMI